MFALRSVARSSARVVPRLGSTSFRSAAGATRPAAIRATATVFVNRTCAYGTEVAKTGDVDQELISKLDTELQFESEIKEEDTPKSIKEYMEKSAFKVTDIAGKDDVVLTRDFGDEKITVTFSIVDLANFDESENMYDEEGDGEYEGEERPAENQENEDGEGGDNSSPPCRLHIVVEKPGKSKGALNIEASCSYNQIAIESVFYYDDAKLAHTATPEAEFASQEIYPGPPFDSLDPDVQTLMDRYIEERGINEALAIFATDYMGWKEQREYVSWLNNVKKFVQA